MTMLEKVAKALFEYQQSLRNVAGLSWEYEWATNGNYWMPLARAAINAMREPTPHMLTALHPDERRAAKDERVSGFLDFWDAEDVWKAMISAALDEPPSP